MFIGHAIGCNAVSWAPAVQPGSLIAPQPVDSAPGQPSIQTVKRFASAGCDNLVKIWGYREDSQSWVEEEILEGHTDWVRDVAWAPNIGLPRSYIATASQVTLLPIYSRASAHSLLRTRRCLSGRKTLLHLLGSRRPLTRQHLVLLPRHPPDRPLASSPTLFGASPGLLRAIFSLSAAATEKLRCGRRTSRGSGSASATCPARY